MQQFGRGKPSAGAFFDSSFTTMDDILAIALIYGLQAKNDCRVAVITASRSDLATVGYVDLVERFYHGPAAVFAQLPAVGMPTTGNKGETPKAFLAPFDRKKPDGTPVYKNEVRSVIETGDPNTLIRNYLEAQSDQNAFFILSGPATNLASALEFRGMKDLLTAKIKYLVIASGPGQMNIKADIPAAKKVFDGWPTPIVLAGPDVGDSLPFPGASIDKEFAAANPDHPVADAYRVWKPMPYDTPSFAMSAALYAARPKEGYFKVSDAGSITVGADGKTAFTASAQGKHQYLIPDPAQKDKIIAAYVELASAKPVVRQRFQQKKADDPAAADLQKKAEDPADKVVIPPKP
jgi:inosine-uridine nucleoside N-ribohydrolase